MSTFPNDPWSNTARRFHLSAFGTQLRGQVNGSEVCVRRLEVPDSVVPTFSVRGTPYVRVTSAPATLVSVELFAPLDFRLMVQAGQHLPIEVAIPGLQAAFFRRWVCTGDWEFDRRFRVGCEEPHRGYALLTPEVRGLLQSVSLPVFSLKIDDRSVELFLPGYFPDEAALTRAIAQGVLLAQAMDRARMKAPPPHGLDMSNTSFANLAAKYGLSVGSSFLLYGEVEGAKTLIHSTNEAEGLRAQVCLAWASPLDGTFLLATRIGAALGRYSDMLMTASSNMPNVGNSAFRARFVVQGDCPELLARILTPGVSKSLMALAEAWPIRITQQGVFLKPPYCELDQVEQVFEPFLEIVLAVRDILQPVRRDAGPYR